MCKGHRPDKGTSVVRSTDENLKRPVRHKKPVFRTGFNLTLSASGMKSKFGIGAMRKKSFEMRRRARQHRLNRQRTKLAETHSLKKHQPQVLDNNHRSRQITVFFFYDVIFLLLTCCIYNVTANFSRNTTQVAQ